MPQSPQPSLFELLGGEPALRAIISDFIDAVFADTMIGFFFAKADKERVKAKEYEFAAQHLGADLAYSGRPLPALHRQHPIMGGHFMRRLQLLKETLERHQAPPQVIEHWLAHTERMRPAITQQAGSQCNDAGTSRRLPLAFGAVAPAAASGPPSQAERRELPLTASSNPKK